MEKLTALKLAQKIKNASITSKSATEFSYSKAKENKYNAFTGLNENAIKQAKDFDKKQNFNSLLSGVPISIKDNICTKGITTTAASNIIKDFVPTYNATVIDKLISSGMIITAKNNMDEFAMGSTNETSAFGPVLNPHNESCVAGGSSGGSAAAVSAGMSFCALGSDTGGSVRLPASYCGVVGFKPTYGAVSRFGLIAFASSLDQIGTLTKTVKDTAALFDIIKGKDEKDATSVDFTKSAVDNLGKPVKGKKIGIIKEFLDEKTVSEDVISAVKNAVSVLKEQGAQVEYTNLPYTDLTVPVYYIITSAEASSNLARFDSVRYGVRKHSGDTDSIYRDSRSSGFGDEVKKRIILGTYVLSSGFYDAYYLKALKVRRLIKTSYTQLFKKYDALICPTAPTTAPPLNNMKNIDKADIFTAGVNLAGLPAISVPFGKDRYNMPIGVQIIADSFCDCECLSIADTLQEHSGGSYEL